MAITSRALAFASRWFDPVTVATVFEPLVADWQRELQDVSSSSRRASVTLRGFSAFACAVAISSPRTLRTQTPSPVSRRITSQILRFTAIATTLVALILTYSEFELLWRGGLILFLLPSVIAIAFPFAMAGAVDAVRHDDSLPPHVERAVALKIALFAAVFVFGFGGWITPLANREYGLHSEAIAGRAAPLPGVRETNTLHLITDAVRVAEFEAFSGGAGRTARIRGELQNRAALVLLPIVLIWLRWRALALPRRRWVAPLPALAASALSVVAFFTLFFYGFILENRLDMPRGTGTWMPVASLTAWGITAEYRRRLLLAAEHAWATGGKPQEQ